MTKDPLIDQIQAASAEARALVAGALPAAGDVPAVKESPWVKETFDHLLTTPQRCQHLARRPIQPAFAFIWEGYWRCRDCVVDHVTKAKAAGPGAWAGLGDVEEGTCDRCRCEVGPGNLTPAILRSDMFVLNAAICPRCERQMQREGGRTLGS